MATGCTADPAVRRIGIHCFSNEYWDDDLGLVYYNYRYYSPKLGRWLSRDPIEEQGGLNLYGFCGNNGVERIDFLGLYSGCPYGGIPGTDVIDRKGDITAGAKFKPSPSARIVGYKISAGMQTVGGCLEGVTGLGLAGLGGGSELATVGLSSEVSIPAMLFGGYLAINGADNMKTGWNKLFHDIDAVTDTEKVIIVGLMKCGVPREKAECIASGINGGSMMVGGFVGIVKQGPSIVIITKNSKGDVAYRVISEEELATPSSVPAPKSTAGAARAAKFSENWQAVSARDTIKRIAGDNPIVETTVSGKTIYRNPTTGVQVVYDNAGKYFRVENPGVQGTSRYLDQFGKPIPSNVPLIQPGKTTQTGVPSDVRKALTHFSDAD